MDKKYTCVSLFSGAGGLDIGFSNAGFDVIWANDIDKDACNTHKLWSSATVINKDISKIDISKIPDSDIVVGAFPCQGFSLAGPRKIDDKRNKLYRFYVSIVEDKKPKMFIAENVKGLLTLGDGEIIEAIVNDFSEKGYNVAYKLLDTSKYGVPQKRERVIIVGIRKDLDITYNFPEENDSIVTIKDSLKGLKAPKKSEISTEPFSSRFMSRNRKRDWDELSFTIPAMSKQVPLHPSSPDMIYVEKDKWKFGEGKTRRFSYKECAALQTFPKDMDFYGDLISKYKQIGNAVPVKFAEAIAKEVFNTLEKIEED